ncbi:MAG: NAD(P)H-dependent oxidoreductase [Gemmatimonadaceae bacterium]
MLNLHVVVASTREGRQGALVGDWFYACAKAHGKFNVELVDLAVVNLPLLDESKHPRFHEYEHEHTKAWSAIVERADAFVFVTPEYDFGAPAALLNALHYLFREWAYKPVGFASYGGVSAGLRGVQMTKQVVTTLKMMPMMEAVAIPFFAKFIDTETGTFKPGEVQEQAAGVMLDELLRWTNAMKPLRAP